MVALHDDFSWMVHARSEIQDVRIIRRWGEILKWVDKKVQSMVPTVDFYSEKPRTRNCDIDMIICYGWIDANG